MIHQMDFVLALLAIIGWAIAAALGALAYRNWMLVGYWRDRADHFRRALRRCDEQLQRQVDETFEWVKDPTIKDPPRK